MIRYWNRFMGGAGSSDRRLDERSPAQLAAQADAPILLIHGRRDTVVPYDQSEIMARALRAAGKPVELVTLDGEDHNLSQATTRSQMLEATVAFLEQHNPPNTLGRGRSLGRPGFSRGRGRGSGPSCQRPPSRLEADR